MPRIDILFFVDDDVISRLDKKRPKSGGREYYYAKFRINGEIWDDIDNKRASFTRGNDTYIMPLEAYNDCFECKIPWEVMIKPGYFNVGMFGGDRLLTNQVKVDVDRGCLHDGTESVPPTPDWFNKIDMEIDDINSKIENGGVQFTTDETLSLKDGVLRVNTAQEPEPDNTLPITSAAVHTTVGNIEIILQTI